jgi:hypothetical protein
MGGIGEEQGGYKALGVINPEFFSQTYKKVYTVNQKPPCNPPLEKNTI